MAEDNKREQSVDFKVEQVTEETEESVKVCCHDTNAEWVRTFLHLLVLEAVLLPIAHYWHFWYSPTDAIIYAVFILLGKTIWHLVDFGVSVKTAADINQLIRSRRKNDE